MSHRLYAEDTGEGGPVLVLLHGFAGSHHVWDAVRAALGPGPRVIAYDLPGHGRSLHVPGAGRAKAIAEAVACDLEARGVGRFHLAGHSFGGAVSVLLADLVPARVASLTLFAPGGFGPEIAGDLLTARAEARSEAEIAAAVQGMFGPHVALVPAVMKAALALDALPGQREKLLEIARLIVRDGRQGAFPRATLQSLAMPVHVVWGTRDKVLPPAQSEGLPASFTVHRLEGRGHMLPEETPRDVARIIGLSLNDQ